MKEKYSGNNPKLTMIHDREGIHDLQQQLHRADQAYKSSPAQQNQESSGSAVYMTQDPQSYRSSMSQHWRASNPSFDDPIAHDEAGRVGEGSPTMMVSPLNQSKEKDSEKAASKFRKNLRPEGPEGKIKSERLTGTRPEMPDPSKKTKKAPVDKGNPGDNARRNYDKARGKLKKNVKGFEAQESRGNYGDNARPSASNPSGTKSKASKESRGNPGDNARPGTQDPSRKTKKGSVDRGNPGDNARPSTSYSIDRQTRKKYNPL